MSFLRRIVWMWATWLFIWVIYSGSLVLLSSVIGFCFNGFPAKIVQCIVPLFAKKRGLLLK